MMQTYLPQFAFLIGASFASLCGTLASAQANPPKTTIAIAPLEKALTFARAQIDGALCVLAVRTYTNDSVEAIDLSKALGREIGDPIELFNTEGYDALLKWIHDAPESAKVTVPAQSLGIPADLASAHIAAGTNFAEHAEESEVEDGPFLFAKLVAPTPAFGVVSAGEGLLDYEVELGFVTLRDTPLKDGPQAMGLILCNDFTDRATLLRNADPDNVTSGKGFTTGKSAPGFLPVGNLFVVPRDVHAFAAGLHLTLAVNGKQRQDAPMTLAIWDIDELFRQSLARESVVWDYRGVEARLPISAGAVPARTIILAGTPAGTIFSGIPARAMLGGVTSWVFGGWDKPVASRVVESYIARAANGKMFLQPGDHVSIKVETMGVIETSVTQ